MKKILILIFSLIFTVNVYGGEMSVVSQGAVLMDEKTGRVLWKKNMNDQMAMASTTKIMTAIIALESGKTEETVIASKIAASAPEVKMGLKTGEEHRLYDLLYPLMLESSNDAAIAIAEHIGGSVEGFAKLMNDKVKEIGALNTEFVTPNGLDKGNHHSTPYDMALIAAYAIKNTEFLDIINTPQITIPLKNTNEKIYTFTNKNRLLREFEGAIGVKTGFTNKAGQCFVGAAKRDDMTLISVVLASGWGTKGKEQKWIDSKKLLNYGFDNYSYVTVFEEGAEAGNVDVIKGSRENVLAVAEERSLVCVNEEEKNDIDINVNILKSVEAPVKKGQKLGTIEVVLSNGEVLFKTDAVAAEDVERHDFKTCMEKVIKLWFNIDVSLQTILGQ